MLEVESYESEGQSLDEAPRKGSKPIAKCKTPATARCGGPANAGVLGFTGTDKAECGAGLAVFASPAKFVPLHAVQSAEFTDVRLLQQVAEGGKAAMHIIFVRHRDKVFRFVRRMVRDPALADDITSQVFLDVWRAADSFEGRARVSTWLLAIARFKALHALRARTFASIDGDEALDVADPADTPEFSCEKRQQRHAVHTGIFQLSAPHRRVIELYYFRELTIDEIARTIGAPPATVKSRLFYARKQLARILVTHGLRLDAADRTTMPDAPR